MQDQLFIAKVPSDVTDEQLITLFKDVGEVKNFRRPTRRDTGLPESYAFISMATPELDQEAITRLNGYSFSADVPPLVVKHADHPPVQPNQLFVTKIPTEVSDDQLLALFKTVGEVKNVDRKIRRKTGLPQNYAFVHMATPELAQQAIERLNDYSFGEGQPPLIVKYAGSRAQTSGNLFVTKIPQDFSNDQITALFEAVGEVKSFRRPQKRDTGLPETYAFFQMATPELAQQAIERLHGHVLDSEHTLVVKYAEDRPTPKKQVGVIGDPAKLFVAPLPTDFSNEQLIALFEAVGEIADFRRPYKGKEGENAPFAFVTMATPELAQEAIRRLKGHSLGEGLEPLNVKIAEDRPPSAKNTGQKPNKELDRLATEIADRLGETDTMPRLLVKQIVYKCGAELASAWFNETLRVEEQGGMMMETLGRRRTPGGVFFFIAKKNMPAEYLQDVFPKEAVWRKKKDARLTQPSESPAAPPPEPEDPPFDWEQRVQLLKELFDEPGKTLSVKVVVVGRPDSVHINVNQVTLTIKRNFQLAHIPKGVPRPPVFPTTTTIYVPLKMWNKVEEALKDLQDRLVVEGFAAIEPGKQGYSVYGTLVTTAVLQRERFAKSDSPQEKG